MRRIPLWNLPLVWLCLAVVFSLNLPPAEGADPTLTPPTLEDTDGNKADSESRITWAPAPDGLPYNTDTKYEDGGLTPLFNMARGFLGVVQPNPFPTDLIKNVMGNNFNIQQDYMKVVNYAMGFLVCFVIGILFIIIMPIIGCCFCCFRCCGCCGGRMTQKYSPSAGCKRIVFSVVLFILTVFMCVGSVCIYVTSDYMSTAIKKIPTTAVSSMDDINIYLNNTITEMKFVSVTGFNFAATVIFRDLDNIDYLVGVPVRDELGTAAGVDNAINNIIALEANINQVATDLFAVNRSIETLKANGQNLSDELTNVKTNLKNIQTNNPADCDTACQALPTDNLALDVDFNNLPDISNEVKKMEDVQSESLATKATEGKKEFDNIPQRVRNETKDVVSELKTQINSFKSTINSKIDEITNLPNQVLAPVTNVKNDISNYGKMVDDYNQYRWYGGLGLACICMLVVLLQLLGLICGLVGSSADTHPTQRGCASHCGGTMLMAAVGFIFIFSWLLMLLTSISFLIGGNMEKAACEPLMDPKLTVINELVDGPDGLFKGDYILGKTLLGNGSIPLTVDQVLSDCKKGKAAYTALRLSALFDLDAATDYRKVVNIDQELDKINISLSDVTILTANTEQQLRDFTDAINIDFQGFVDELTKNTTKANPGDFAELVRKSKNGSSTTVQNELEAEAVKLDNINKGIYKTVKDNQAQLLADILALNASVAAIPKLVNDTIDAAKAVEQNLGSQGSAIINTEVRKYANRILGVADSFANNTLNAVKNELAACTPVWNLWYSVIHLILCKYVVDTFNGFWFGLGWAIFFMVPSIIFNVKLAKHFRRMNHAEDYPPFDGVDKDLNMKKNRVHPA